LTFANWQVHGGTPDRMRGEQDVDVSGNGGREISSSGAHTDVYPFANCAALAL
jgi:hypothetical protein